MNNEKILNLSDVNTEDFEVIKGAIEDWKVCGLPGQFTFLADETLQNTYNRGVWHGGFALIGGICLGTAIYLVGERFATKK